VSKGSSVEVDTEAGGGGGVDVVVVVAMMCGFEVRSMFPLE
jgi:hypothetical protein